MDHETAQNLIIEQAYAELSSAREKAFLLHIEHCPECENQLFAVKNFLGVYRAAPCPPPPLEIIPEVLATVLQVREAESESQVAVESEPGAEIKVAAAKSVSSEEFPSAESVPDLTNVANETPPADENTPEAESTDDAENADEVEEEAENKNESYEQDAAAEIAEVSEEESSAGVAGEMAGTEKTKDADEKTLVAVVSESEPESIDEGEFRREDELALPETEKFAAKTLAAMLAPTTAKPRPFWRHPVWSLAALFMLVMAGVLVSSKLRDDSTQAPRENSFSTELSALPKNHAKEKSSAPAPAAFESEKKTSSEKAVKFKDGLALASAATSASAQPESVTNTRRMSVSKGASPLDETVATPAKKSRALAGRSRKRFEKEEADNLALAKNKRFAKQPADIGINKLSPLTPPAKTPSAPKEDTVPVVALQQSVEDARSEPTPEQALEPLAVVEEKESEEKPPVLSPLLLGKTKSRKAEKTRDEVLANTKDATPSPPPPVPALKTLVAKDKVTVETKAAAKGAVEKKPTRELVPQAASSSRLAKATATQKPLTVSRGKSKAEPAITAIPSESVAEKLTGSPVKKIVIPEAEKTRSADSLDTPVKKPTPPASESTKQATSSQAKKDAVVAGHLAMARFWYSKNNFARSLAEIARITGFQKLPTATQAELLTIKAHCEAKFARATELRKTLGELAVLDRNAARSLRHEYGTLLRQKTPAQTSKSPFKKFTSLFGIGRHHKKQQPKTADKIVVTKTKKSAEVESRPVKHQVRKKAKKSPPRQRRGFHPSTDDYDKK